MKVNKTLSSREKWSIVSKYRKMYYYYYLFHSVCTRGLFFPNVFRFPGNGKNKTIEIPEKSTQYLASIGIFSSFICGPIT